MADGKPRLQDRPEVTGIRQVDRLREPTGELGMVPAPTAFPSEFGLRNEGTRMLPRTDAPVPLPTIVEPLPLQGLFKARLDAIRRAYQGTPEQACMVAAIDPARGVAASVRVLAPGGGEPATLTIGRHERCQLRLMDPAVSLRHAVLVLRRLPTGDLRVRLIDLRSGLGLTGEDGRMLESVSVEGHLFIGMGRYVLVVMLGGEDLAFSDDGAEVFDTFPQRVFFDARERVPGVSSPRRARVPVPDEAMIFASGTRTRARARGILDFHSRVSIHRPPEPLRKVPSYVLEGDRRGTINLRCDAGEASVPLYDAQVRDGVLLGRYDRCESADLPFDLPDTVSRVHALILAEGDGLYMVDTASTVGVRNAAGDEVPLIKLNDEMKIGLGTETTVHWVPGT